MSERDTWVNRFNRLLNETDMLYSTVARDVGLSDCAFWILYTLRTLECPMPQNEICACLHQSKQTVSSALKRMEAKGYVTLTSSPPDLRFKQVDLTETGMQLAHNTVDRVIALEQGSFSCLDDSELEVFIRLFERYTESLKSDLQTLKTRGSQ